MLSGRSSIERKRGGANAGGSSRVLGHDKLEEIEKKQKADVDRPPTLTVGVLSTPYTAATTSDPQPSSEGPSWLRPGFEFPYTVVGMERLANEINDLSPSLANLHISNPKNAVILGRSVISRCHDPDLYRKISNMGYREVFNRFGGLISQISTLGLFMADAFERTDAIAAYAMNIEKKCSQVETAAAEWKAKCKAMVRKANLLQNEKNKAQAELTPLQAEVKELKAKLAASEACSKELADKNAKLIDSEKEAKNAADRLEKEVEYFRSRASPT